MRVYIITAFSRDFTQWPSWIYYEMMSFFAPKLLLKMAEEFQKYKDILKREQDEFRKQLVREVRISRFFLFQ